MLTIIDGVLFLQRTAEFVAHASNINCVVLSPSNGRLLATGGDDRKINLWSPGKPNNILSISGITSPVQSVAFNNSENWIGAGSKSGVIKVFDLEEKKSKLAWLHMHHAIAGYVIVYTHQSFQTSTSILYIRLWYYPPQ